jgi:DNA polymerase V
MDNINLKEIIAASIVEPYLADVSKSVSLPVIEEPANAGANLPFLNEDLFKKSMDLNDEFIHQPANNFIFKVSGDSMQPDIEDGCLVVVDTLKKCMSGSIVIAAVDGSLVIKRYIEENGRAYLRSSNRYYRDIPITEFTDFQIWGVVISKHTRL